MDRAGANFLRCVDQIRTRLKGNPVVIQLPIGAEENFTGIVDLIRMKAIWWDDETQGMRFEYRDIPEDMKAQCDEFRTKLVESAAEGNEELLHKYLEDNTLSTEDIRKGLRERAIRNEICIVTCGSAFKNKGVQAVLDAVIDFMPSPAEVADVKGQTEEGEEITRAPHGRGAILRARVQDPERPLRRQPDVLPGLFRHAELGRPGLRAEPLAQGAHRPPAADARERARGNQGSPRRRHRRGRGPQGRHDRRHAFRSGRRSSCSRRWNSRRR